MTAKGIIDVYLDRPLHSTITNIVKVNSNLPKLQNGREVSNAPRQIVYVKEECFSHSSGAKVTKSNSFCNAAQYKRTTGHLEQMGNHNSFIESGLYILNNIDVTAYSYL